MSPINTFVSPADLSPTFGKCKVAFRNLAKSPVNEHGFIVFKEVVLKNNFPKNGEDRLYYITKGTTNANAYFYQTAAQLSLYVFLNPMPPVALSQEQVLGGFTSSATIHTLTRDKFILLEPTGDDFQLIDRGTSKATLGNIGGQAVVHIAYPLVKLTKSHFGYDKDVFYFKDSEETLEDIRCNNCGFQVDTNVRDILNQNNVVVSPIAYPIHLPTGKQYALGIASNDLPPAVVFEASDSTRTVFETNAYGGLRLTQTKETPAMMGLFKGTDYIRFKYQGRQTKYIFGYHHKKYAYTQPIFAANNQLMARKALPSLPFVLNAMLVSTASQIALREAEEGGGDPNSIPMP